MRKDWLWFAGGILAGALVVLALALPAAAGTGLSGGYGGVFTFHTDTNVVTGSAYSLGLTLRPDKVAQLAPETPNKFKVVPSSFMFNVAYSVRDGDPDYTFLGAGYEVANWGTIGLVIDGAAVTHQIGDNSYRVGGVGGIRMPFTTLGENWEFRVSGGYDGDNPIMLIGLCFTTADSE